MTYREAIQEGTKALTLSSDADAALDARLLLEAVCGTNLNTLFLSPEREVSKEEIEAYWGFLRRREAHEPTAMILGHAGFMGFDFIVDPNVLIPEQDSEVLVETALDLGKGKKNLRVLDLCTGSGCLLFSFLTLQGNGSTGVGTDLSEKALQVAEKNRMALGLTERAELYQGDLFEALSGRSLEHSFDLVLSNPPYIQTGVIETLPEEVRCGEPYMALDGGADGLSFYRRIIPKAKDFLAPGGCLLLEIGYDEGDDVLSLCREAGYAETSLKKDYGGKDRVVTAAL